MRRQDASSGDAAEARGSIGIRHSLMTLVGNFLWQSIVVMTKVSVTVVAQ